ncbi:synaptic vesicle membrane protein VAT-1 homolog [Anoplophora glabripennis]|uniref:synaptic vesicle membrane protein VAT-1 homolog n=1 Tax=Anoplophora glabripennis TaxID=217634 RepID=UPI000873561E|nr:synaptic vesicle membrane protein VAT-1 homolog [Anoplophora glabripennis]
MKAEKSRSVIVKKFGGYDCLLIENFDLPELDGLIEVKVDCGGLNFADLYTRQGLMLDKKLPFVLGMECTGTVTAVGTETDLVIGQKVICYDYEGGMYRDVIRVSPEKCYPLPEYIDSKIGAAIFVNYLTAYFALIGLGNLKENEKVLIMSCAGGVGCAATQLARTIKDVKIFGIGSQGKEQQAKENGVDIFYSNESFKAEIIKEKFDLIIANEIGPTFTYLQNILNPLGRIVLTGANNIITNERKLSMFSLLKAWWSTKYVNPETLITNNRLVGGLHLGTLAKSDPKTTKNALNYIFDLLRTGVINPKIHSVMPMSEIIAATKLLGDRKNVGKVLIQMEET